VQVVKQSSFIDDWNQGRSIHVSRVYPANTWETENKAT
jgi:hypothetical protein